MVSSSNWKRNRQWEESWQLLREMGYNWDFWTRGSSQTWIGHLMLKYSIIEFQITTLLTNVETTLRDGSAGRGAKTLAFTAKSGLQRARAAEREVAPSSHRC
jgi:hypothetical protein